MNLIVSNISYRLNEGHIRELFEVFGVVVSVKLVKDKETGYSKGLAYVKMQTEKTGAMAVSKLNGVNLDGRSLRVQQSEDKTNKNR